jgi:hypothetical protein
LTPRFLHAWQSSAAPVAGALLLRFLGAAVAVLVVVAVVAVVVLFGLWTSTAWVTDDDMFVEEGIVGEVLQVFSIQLCTVVGCYIVAVKRINKR